MKKLNYTTGKYVSVSIKIKVPFGLGKLWRMTSIESLKAVDNVAPNINEQVRQKALLTGAGLSS